METLRVDEKVILDTARGYGIGRVIEQRSGSTRRADKKGGPINTACPPAVCLKRFELRTRIMAKLVDGVNCAPELINWVFNLYLDLPLWGQHFMVLKGWWFSSWNFNVVTVRFSPCLGGRRL